MGTALLDGGAGLQYDCDHEQPAPELVYVAPFARKEVWSLVFLAAACLSAIFTDFNNVPLLSVAWPALFLCYYTGASRRWHAAAAWLCVSAFRAVGGADYFKEGMSGTTSYFIGFAFVLVSYGLILLPAMAAQVAIWKHFPRLGPSPLVFPTIMTGISQLWWAFSPIGASSNPALGLAFEPTIRQTAALFGEISLVFIVGWVASLSAGLLVGRVTRGHGGVALGVGLFMLIFGGIRSNAGRGMWLEDIKAWPASATSDSTPTGVFPAGNLHSGPSRSLQVSCLADLPVHVLRHQTTPKLAQRTTMRLAKLAQRTNMRLATGDDIVMWSESAGGRIANLTLNTAQLGIDWSLARTPRSVVGVAYYDRDHTSETTYNSFALLQDGQVLSNYRKNRPVPISEAGITAGSISPHAVEVTTPSNATLQVATAICFDFDFPDVIRHVGGEADLVIGPSDYSDSIGYIIWGDNVFRYA